MKTKFTELEVIEIIKNVYPRATNVKKMTEGLVSQTYFFANIDDQLVFQISKDIEGYYKEDYVYRTFSKYISVKEIQKIDNLYDDIYYCISKYIDAKRLHDLTLDEINQIEKNILETLELMKKIEIDDDNGFGYFDSKGVAKYLTWKDFILAIKNTGYYNWDLSDRKICEIINSCINEIEKYCDVIDSKRHLLHGDFGSYNVLTDNKKVYLIDWSLGLYGDPLYEIANILFWNEKCLSPIVDILKNTYETKNKQKIYVYLLRIGLEEIYRTQKNKESGFNIEWLLKRVEEIIRLNHK